MNQQNVRFCSGSSLSLGSLFWHFHSLTLRPRDILKFKLTFKPWEMDMEKNADPKHLPLVNSVSANNFSLPPSGRRGAT